MIYISKLCRGLKGLNLFTSHINRNVQRTAVQSQRAVTGQILPFSFTQKITSQHATDAKDGGRHPIVLVSKYTATGFSSLSPLTGLGNVKTVCLNTRDMCSWSLIDILKSTMRAFHHLWDKRMFVSSI